MLRRKLGFQRPLMMALTLVLAFSAGSALTASGQGDVTFYGCEIPNGMVIQITTHELNCPRRTNLVSWGSQGVPGPAGQSGVSHAYVGRGFRFQQAVAAWVMSVTVPAGSYVVTAEVIPQNVLFAPSGVTCTVHPGQTSGISNMDGFGRIDTPITLLDAVTLTEDGPITVECSDVTSSLIPFDGVITAVAVDALN